MPETIVSVCAALLGLLGAALIAFAPTHARNLAEETSIIRAANGFWVISNLYWLVLAGQHHDWPQMAMFCGYLVFAVRGWLVWR